MKNLFLLESNSLFQKLFYKLKKKESRKTKDFFSLKIFILQKLYILI